METCASVIKCHLYGLGPRGLLHRRGASLGVVVCESMLREQDDAVVDFVGVGSGLAASWVD